jgi:hypothetical protein
MFVPPYGELHRLPTPLNEGEQAVADVLRELDEEWRVFVEPRMLMDKPDFVVTHARFGVCAIEVKDWAPDLYRQDVEGAIWCQESPGSWVKTRQAPKFQAHRYRSTIFERFFALPEADEQDFAVVRGVVILPRYTGVAARKLLAVHRVSQEQEERVRVFGGDDLKQRLRYIVTGYANPYGMRVPPRSLTRLHQQLAEPEFIANQRRPLRLSEDAKNIRNNPSNATTRRVRGPAGSGKSLGLAARAATLAAAGQRVLVLGFNITLPHYLHDLAARYGRELGASIRQIDFIHFHGFCNHIRRSHEVATGAARVKQDTEDDRYFALEQQQHNGRVEWLVEAAIDAYRAGHGERYASILVDEGQDFSAKWWDFLRELVWNGPPGEMLLVADAVQDVYDRRGWLSEPSMTGCGFSGPWTNLRGSYRMPPDLVPIIAEYAQEHLEAPPPVALTVPSDRRGEAFEPTVRSWVDVDDDAVAGAVAQQVQEYLREGVAPGDVVFLCEDHHIGLDIAELLEQRDVYVSHVFTEEDDKERRHRKLRFWGGIDGVKGCTVHSFKGWEAQAVVLAPTPRAE